VTDHPTRLVIFTDLDGTLLDHENYSWQGAQPALARVKASGTPWVLCTSKTRAELEPLRDALDHRHPFIVENGGAILIPHGYFTVPLPPHVTINRYQIIQLGAPYPLLRRTLDEIKDASGVPIRGYGDLTVQEVAALTGLPLEAATRAKAREYDEPFIIGVEGEGTEADRRRVLSLIEAKGFRWTRGGRFHHLMGRHDKGNAVSILTDVYRTQYGSIITVGLGDSYNDLPMLGAVDRPILVKRPDGRYDPDVALPGLEFADGIGPAGWNAAITALLDATDAKTPPPSASPS
jgi:mannosyl-3-phosphoglycerate phosphatase